MTFEDHRTEAALLELARRRRKAFEPHASANGRLRQAVKHFEAASGAARSRQQRIN